ncbi:unnamed protein product [Macrosiphum euphorbiae]|uniref:Peptidase A2 domain-containing protein n=1 Tax=Macrosiphum euphorbiae TaxID=13131 RepID=A0AAV0W2H6_9HEMI|nr:unnamed protein product [Macrosiphum euphorbiae]
MLVDSGAEISAISTEHEKAILILDNSTPILPLSGMTIHNATGDKSIKVNRQLLIPLSIEKTVIQTPFIVVPTLNEGGILGNDFLETHKAIIDFGEKTVTITVEQNELKIPFINKRNGAPMHLKTVQTGISKEPIHPRRINIHSHLEQKYLDKILKKFSTVFRSEPGKIKNYQCKIKLKNDTPICVKPYPKPIVKTKAEKRENKKRNLKIHKYEVGQQILIKKPPTIKCRTRENKETVQPFQRAVRGSKNNKPEYISNTRPDNGQTTADKHR